MLLQNHYFRIPILLQLEAISLQVTPYNSITMPKPATADYDETFKRLTVYDGVEGVIIINSDGVPIRSSLDNETTVQYAYLLTPLISRTRSYLKEIDVHNGDFTFLRLVTKLHEIMVAPDKDYSLIVIQVPKHRRKDTEEEDGIKMRRN